LRHWSNAPSRPVVRLALALALAVTMALAAAEAIATAINGRGGEEWGRGQRAVQPGRWA
jgi:hypothetical protein